MNAVNVKDVVKNQVYPVCEERPAELCGVNSVAQQVTTVPIKNIILSCFQVCV